MATFKAESLKHHLKKDGKVNIKLLITHHRKKAYTSTNLFADAKDLNKDFKVKNRVLLKQMTALEDSYYAEANKMGSEIDKYDVKDLAQVLATRVSKLTDGNIDFHKFGREYIEKLKKAGRESYAAKFTRALNNLVDFFKKDIIYATDINVSNLYKFEAFLKAPREYKRRNQFGREVTYKSEGSGNGVIDTMGCVRKLFNEIKKHYNDEDLDQILIKHSPFNKYNVGSVTEESDNRILTLEQIISIRDYDQVKPGSLMELGRDLFMLSFYLVAINTVDLYYVDVSNHGRLDYKRRKTTNRRKDKAFISIKIEPEARLLIDKYSDPSGERLFKFYKMYASSKGFNNAINKGLKDLAEVLSLPDDLTSYYVRHSWPTIARNIAGVNKDDVAMAMNHVDAAHQVTDIYIQKDWSHIDDANRKVLNLIHNSHQSVNWDLSLEELLDY